MQRLYAALRSEDIDAIERAMWETQQHAAACARLQQDLEVQQAAAGTSSLHALLAALIAIPGSSGLLEVVEQLTHELACVSNLRADIASLTSGLITLNQEMIASVSRQASAGPTYDAHSSPRRARINTRLIDASA
jgi:hypothetical protein